MKAPALFKFYILFVLLLVFSQLYSVNVNYLFMTEMTII